MPDKDFEEQVRERAGALSLEPSSTVRASILERVRQRRRRRAFFWIPLLLGLVLAGAWGALRVHRRGAGATAPSVAKPATTAPSVAAHVPAATSAAVPQSAATEPSVAVYVPAATPPPASAAPQSASAAPQSASAAPQSASAALPPASAALPPDLFYTDNADIPDKGWSLTKATRGSTPNYTEPGRTIVDFAKGVSLPKKLKIYGGAGLSGQGAFGSFRTPAGVQWVSLPTSAATGLGTTGSPGTSYHDSLAGVRAMAGFQLGFQIEFPLWKTLSWGLGLEYDFSKTNIGPVVPSSLYTALPGSVSYGGSGGAEFENRYGLLSVPLNLTWESHHLRNLSLSIGLAPAYLVSVHALEYNPENGGYMTGNDLFRRWQLSGEAALSLNLWQFGDWALSGGPFFRYDFQSLQRSAPVSDHLNSLELRLALTRSFKKISHEK